MSTLAKIVVGITCLLIISCVGVAVLAAGSLGAVGLFAANSIQKDPARINAAATRIADFDLPAGFKPEATAEIGGYLFVSYAPGDGHSHIQFVQAPANSKLDQTTVEGLMQQIGTAPSGDGSLPAQEVSSGQTTIRGQKVTLLVSHGANHDHEPFRTVSAVFDGKGGPAFISIESPLSTWNQAAVDRFLASIH